MRVFAMFVCLHFISNLAAETPEKANPVFLIKAARLLDVKNGQYVPEPGILVENGKIKKVGSFAAVRKLVPETTKLIDLGNATILPGLIDCHTHLTVDPEFLNYSYLTLSTPRLTLYGVKNARATLLAGFTTVRNVHADHFIDVALRDAINDGGIVGPRMLVSGPALSITGGHGDNNELPWEKHDTAEGVADGVDGVRRKVRENIKFGADLIKICASGGVLSKGDDPQAAQYTLEEMEAIVAEAHRLNRRVAAHAHGAQAIQWAVKAGVDSIEHGSYIDDAGIELMNQRGTYLVPTRYLYSWMPENMKRLGLPDYMQEKMRGIQPIVNEHHRKAVARRVKVAFGTDSGVYAHGLNGREFKTYTEIGLSPFQAVQTATCNAAELLGWSDRIGSLEPGKHADLIAVLGDPLTDITELERVKFVMKGGIVYKNELAAP